MATVIGVRFKKPGKVYYFDPCGLDVKMDDPVVVETVRGVEMGECARAPYEVPDEDIHQADILPVRVRHGRLLLFQP